MATIKTLTNLANPTGTEDVVVQNENGNFKMMYKPTLKWSGNLGSLSTSAEVINAALDAVRSAYGDLEDYSVQIYGAVANWSNGVQIFANSVKSGTYIVWYGIMFSQAGGIVAFSRWDTIGGAAGTVRTSSLGNNLA